VHLSAAFDPSNHDLAFDVTALFIHFIIYVAWPQVDVLEEGPHQCVASQRQPTTKSQVRFAVRTLYLEATLFLLVFVLLDRVGW
jgi:hypothetical protein